MRHSPGGLPEVPESSAQRLPVPKPTVVFCEVEGGAVLLSTEDETYFGLNGVGARIWTLLPLHRTVESLCQALGTIWPDVDPVTLQGDALALLDDLTRNGLVTQV